MWHLPRLCAALVKFLCSPRGRGNKWGLCQPLCAYIFCWKYTILSAHRLVRFLPGELTISIQTWLVPTRTLTIFTQCWLVSARWTVLHTAIYRVTGRLAAFTIWIKECISFPKSYHCITRVNLLKIMKWPFPKMNSIWLPVDLHPFPFMPCQSSHSNNEIKVLLGEQYYYVNWLDIILLTYMYVASLLM